MKFFTAALDILTRMSLPVRGAWVEMCVFSILLFMLVSRSPCGERGLKLDYLHKMLPMGWSLPCGERGLK